MAASSDPSIVVSKSTFRSSDCKLQLYRICWRPAENLPPPRAIMLMHHGLKDYADRNGELAATLVKAGFVVHGYDMRGHGHSEGQRLLFEDFGLLVCDLNAFYDMVLKEEEELRKKRAQGQQQQEGGKLPVFLWGHSIGGCVSSLWYMRLRRPINGLVLCAPALKKPAEAGALLVGAVRLTSRLLPGAGVFNPPPNDTFVRDPEAVKRIDADPLVFQKAGPAITAVTILDALEEMAPSYEKLDCPLLLLHGEADRVRSSSHDIHWSSYVRNSSHERIIYTGCDARWQPDGVRAVAIQRQAAQDVSQGVP
jgi:acylglycerol lipase